jgi:hypothetical protein
MIDIIIVNWNSGKLLSDCIDSIESDNIENIGKIIVVDNHSRDQSEVLCNQSTKVVVVKNPKNYGFAKSCNIGAMYCDSEFILFLNPDTVLFPNSLSETLKFMRRNANQNIGITGIQLLDSHGTIARHSSDFPTPFSFFIRSTGIHKIFLSLDHVSSDWDHDQTKEVSHVIGAYFFVRRKLYDQLEGFDERFFIYLEDLDFSVRAKALGFSTYFISSIQSMHIGGGVSRKIKAKRLFYSLRSRIIYSYKHFDFLSSTAIMMSVIFIEPISRIVFSIKNYSFASIKNLFKAYTLLLKWLYIWIPDQISKNLGR